MCKFIILSICLGFFIACLPSKKIAKKQPKTVGQYVHNWCGIPVFSTVLELYDDSTFQLAGLLGESDDYNSCAFSKFKGTYRFLRDSLLLDIKYRQHNFYGKNGLPNLAMWGDVKNFAHLSDAPNYLDKEAILFKETFWDKNGYLLEIKRGIYLSNPSSGTTSIRLSEVDYLPTSFFQKHPDLVDTAFYRTVGRYCTAAAIQKEKEKYKAALAQRKRKVQKEYKKNK